MNPISSASQGLLSATTRFDAAVSKLSGTPLNATSPQALVDLYAARQQVSAAVAAVRVADEPRKNLLDIIV